MIDLRDAVNKNENPGKIIAIVEKIFEFDKKKQKGKGLKILTTKQILRKLTIALAKIKAGKIYYIKSVKSYILCNDHKNY